MRENSETCGLPNVRRPRLILRQGEELENAEDGTIQRKRGLESLTPGEDAMKTVEMIIKDLEFT